MHDKRLRRLEQIRLGLEFVVSSRGRVGRIENMGDGCDLVDEKEFEGTSTPEGNECRLQARLKYLIDVLLCELNPSVTCCQDAADKYCETWENCPD